MPRRLSMKRIYDPPAATDGTRILVDRLWPRGLTKAAAKVDHWVREIAPSNELRRWYAHDHVKWPEFRKANLHEAIADYSRRDRRFGAIRETE